MMHCREEAPVTIERTSIEGVSVARTQNAVKCMRKRQAHEARQITSLLAACMTSKVNCDQLVKVRQFHEACHQSGQLPEWATMRIMAPIDVVHARAQRLVRLTLAAASCLAIVVIGPSLHRQLASVSASFHS